MTQPLVVNLINHSISTESVMNQFASGFLCEFPELKESDLTMHKIDDNGQFNFEVHVNEKEKVNFQIWVFNNIKQLRQIALRGQFDQRDRNNDYVYSAATKIAHIMMTHGGQQISSEVSRNPLDAVIDLIYHSYIDKDAFRPLAEHRQLHYDDSDEYQDDYDDYQEQSNYNQSNNRSQYKQAPGNYGSQTSKQNQGDSALGSIFHRFFG